MRYMMMLRIEENTDMVPSEQLMEDMGKLIEEMTKAGVLLDTGGLRPTAEGTRIKLSGGKLTVIDGPFTEAKEVIGGYAMIETKSKEEALEWASRFLRIHGDGWEIVSEIRQIEGPND
ncbi:transcriptional regulator [Streptomyces sp. SID13666]|uniref:YciI family protein n=1 Tax=Streptomyces TaxID=1883 RepID=UPI00110627F6|nr:MULTISPECIES: YciI family protein [Streptomyces]MCZ4099474.1 YciI family protein [Streptomyces sp. H39-C1]NEA56666.1 transcriptional regulator [Streptomyces sp. SID13666]NEA73110.1 transcriptional regulator [Streptomyces sp. SID13588]QNA74577.1 transcriptional regulator [Streptomyces sp. So13.3]